MAVKDRLRGVPVVGTALAVQERYQEDAGDQFAGAIGFFGFLSLFPLLVLALAVTGFVLADASDAEIARVASTVQDAIPGFSGVLGGGDDGSSTEVAAALDAVVRNRGSVGLVGLVTLLLGGLRILNAAQTATVRIFRVDVDDVPGWRRKVQQLVALTVLGSLALLSVAAASAIGVATRATVPGALGVVVPVVTTAATLLLDLALFLVAYRMLGTTAGPPMRQLLPGAVLAAIGWTLLKLFGATWVSDQVASAGELYGALGGVIGLLLLLYLAGRLYVYGAEFSAVRSPDPEHPSHVPEPEPARDAASDGRARAEVDPAVGSSATAARLASMPPPVRQAGQGRQALGFAMAVGAVAGLVGVLRPWDTDR